MKIHLIFITIFFLCGCNQKPNQKNSNQADNSLKFYHKTQTYARIWTDEPRRIKLLRVLKKAHEEGLNPKDYAIDLLTNYETNKNKLDSIEWEKYDQLLTKSVKNYCIHLMSGKLNPKKIYRNWDLTPEPIIGDSTLISWLKSDSIFEKINALQPKHEGYRRLKNALKLINGFPEIDFNPIYSKDKIIENDSLKVVITIKKRLIYWKDLAPMDSINGVYDQPTVMAVKRFQLRHGLATDGIIGKGTLAALNFSKKQRKEQIIVNLERWRWFPKNLGSEYIIINIPDYKLTLVKNNDTLRTHRVIVGRPKRKTPVLSSKLTKVIFNPTWTVPPTILREDVIPAILKSRSYLSKTNIVLYDQKGKKVAASNWQLANAKSYRYVQSPGTFNSLGMVKFIFPNRFSVYLHDTNHRDYFDLPIRDLSSGCVRVDSPLELTEYVLNDPNRWSIPQITKTLQSGRTQEVKINKTIRFHLLYWTAWSEKNQLLFRDDIYNLDANLFSKLSP
jgi:murein L,D-transpeptidase YcbB/YkuD